MAERAKERLGDCYSPEFLGTVLDATYRGTSQRPFKR
jgi:hypothetical protein